MPRRHGPTRLVVGLLGSVLLTACQSGPPTGRSTSTPSSPSHQQQRPALLPPSVATGPNLTPQQRLTALAASIAAVPADTTTDRPYTYLHLQMWNRATNAITRTDLRRWRRSADNSGRETTRRLPDMLGVNHHPDPDERKLFAHAPQKTTQYGQGTLRHYLPEPSPTDPTTLAHALAPPILANEPAYPLLLASGVVGLATSQYLNHQQRIATLRLLASIPTITYQGKTTDIAGRTGLAFAVTADGSTWQLIIDGHTGELLAGHERVTGTRPGLFSYVLILERGHTTDTSEPCEPPTPVE
ncbi:hypothetical protein ACGFIR_00055 [Micromonospora sp. NPDC049051]|uniref:hypothetical protein n=1 Tax=Micromonospora sp. NPDC049051 TaxID=3364264 RepID=UPI00371E218E